MKADIYKATDADHPGIRVYLLLPAGAVPESLPPAVRDRFQILGFIKTVDLGTERGFLLSDPFTALRNLHKNGYHLELPPEGMG